MNELEQIVYRQKENLVNSLEHSQASMKRQVTLYTVNDNIRGILNVGSNGVCTFHIISSKQTTYRSVSNGL